jgi:hypothetical protein
MRNSYLLSFIALALGLPLAGTGATDSGSKANQAAAAAQPVHSTLPNTAGDSMSTPAADPSLDSAQ